jgi:ribosomal protein L23
MILPRLILFSWSLLFGTGNFLVHKAENKNLHKHPFYVSVTQIEENTKESILEVSCRIFTDDFEKTLRMHYTNHIDLLNPPDKAKMNQLINDYITKHLSISIDEKRHPLQFVGYEKNEEAVECYFQVNNISVKKNISVFNNLLFEYKPEQINIVHVTVKGKRKSRQLINPDAKVNFEF